MLFKLAFLSFAATALAHIPLDPACPEGFYPGVQINDFQFDQPFQKFYERTKSFFNASWYDGTEVEHTSGPDNTPGSIREGTGTGEFKEVLIAYYSDETSMYQKYTGLVTQNFTLPAKPGKQFSYVSYTEQFGFDSSCGGNATAIHMIVIFCGNDPVAVADGWSLVRQSAMQTLAVELGAIAFVGNCPASY